MNRLVHLAVVAAALLPAAAGAGEPDLPPPLADLAARLGVTPLAELPPEPGLDDYCAYAVAHNGDLAAAVAGWQAAGERGGAVGALPDPRFTWSEAVESVETRVGPQERILALTQQVPWFGTLGLRRGIEGERAAAAGARAEATARAVLRDVRAAWHELAYLELARQTTAGHLDLLVQWETVARSRYEAGAGSYADVIKAQVEMGMLEDRLAGLEDRRRPLAARLNAALGREAGAAVRAEPVAADESPVDLEDLRARLLAANPDLVLAGHDAAGQRLSGDLAGKKRWPDLSLGVNWVQVGAARMDGVADSGKDAFFATVGVSLPLWQGSYGAAEREADGRYRAAEHHRADLARKLTAQLEQAAYEHRDARRRASLYRDTLLPKARQSLDAARAAYESGEAPFLGLIDAERVLLEFELSARRAAADLMISRAEIDRLVGAAPSPAAGDPAAPKEE